MKKGEEDIREKIQQSGCFFMPRDAFTSELHLAAWLDLSRRTVIETFFHPDGTEGAAHMLAGTRKVCTTDAVIDTIERLAKPQAKSARKGGNRKCRGSRTSSD